MPKLYEFKSTQINRSKDGKILIVQKPRIKRWASVQHVEIILAPTMERYQFVNKSEQGKIGTFFLYEKKPSLDMLERGCDKCAGPHKKNQLTCSAAMNRISPLSRKQGFYNIITGKKIEPQPKKLMVVETSRNGLIELVAMRFG